MQTYEPSHDKSKVSEEENAHGYVPRRCDFKCYKCRHQGVCVIPRRIIEARKRFVRNNISGNMTLLNNKYGFNSFLKVLGYRKKLFRYLAYAKKKLYGKDSE